MLRKKTHVVRKKTHVVRKKTHVVRKFFYVASIFGGAAGRRNRPPWELSSTSWELSSTAGDFSSTASRRRQRLQCVDRAPVFYRGAHTSLPDTNSLKHSRAELVLRQATRCPFSVKFFSSPRPILTSSEEYENAGSDGPHRYLLVRLWKIVITYIRRATWTTAPS